LLTASAISAQSHAGHCSWIWICAYFVVMTIGELFVLPVGLGLFARLAPAGYPGTAIALWFLAAFVGNLLAGLFGTLWSRLDAQEFFLITAATAAIPAVLLPIFGRSVARAESA
jgi:POT family proton-dependent oligopeptide transporter